MKEVDNPTLKSLLSAKSLALKVSDYIYIGLIESENNIRTFLAQTIFTGFSLELQKPNWNTFDELLQQFFVEQECIEKLLMLDNCYDISKVL